MKKKICFKGFCGFQNGKLIKGTFNKEKKKYREIKYNSEESKEEFLKITQTKREISQTENIYLEYAVKRSLSFSLSDSQRLQKQGLTLLCSCLRIFQKAIDFKALLRLFNEQSASRNILSKNDKKFFTFGIIHVHLIVLRALSRLDLPAKDEALACQSAILNICKGNPLGLQILGGSVLSDTNLSQGMVLESLGNIFQLLLENIQSVSLFSLDFFLAAHKLLRNLGKQGSAYDSLKKSLLEKSAKIKKVDGMRAILKELFACEERHFSNGMIRRIARGVVELHQLRAPNWDALAEIMSRILQLFEGRNEGFWPIKTKKKKKPKAAPKRQSLLSKSLKAFLHKVLAEMLVATLQFEPSKKKRAILFKMIANEQQSQIFRNALNTVFRTEGTKGQKRSKIVLELLKSKKSDSPAFKQYVSKIDALLENAGDDQHTLNRKRECKNFAIGMLGDSEKWTRQKLRKWKAQTESALKEGDLQTLKNGVEGCANFLFMAPFRASLGQSFEWLLRVTGKVLKSVPSFKEVLKENSQRRVFTQLCAFIFQRTRKAILKSKSPQETEAQRQKRVSQSIRSFLEHSQELVEELEHSKENHFSEIKQSFLAPSASQIKMNLDNCLYLLSAAEALESTSSDQALNLRDLLLSLSLRNVFLEAKMTEPLAVESGAAEILAEEGENLPELDEQNENISQESKELSEESAEDEAPVRAVDPFTSALRDLVRFVNEFRRENLGSNDFHILTDCLCVLMSDPDQLTRSKVLVVFEGFADHYDEEILELVDGFLFEDLGDKVEAIESHGLGVKLEHLDIGEDILVDSDLEREAQGNAQQKLKLKRVKA